MRDVKDEIVEDVMHDILSERERQDAKWGSIHDRRHEVTASEWITILTEEVGEMAEAVLERDEGAVYDEGVQVAAVVLSILTAMMLDLEDGEVFV